MRAYSKTLGLMDWTHVAFPPFSPEACKKKWEEILKKVNCVLHSLFRTCHNLKCVLVAEMNSLSRPKIALVFVKTLLGLLHH